MTGGSAATQRSTRSWRASSTSLPTTSGCNTPRPARAHRPAPSAVSLSRPRGPKSSAWSSRQPNATRARATRSTKQLSRRSNREPGSNHKSRITSHESPMLFGWIPADPAADAREVVPTMAEALRTTTSQRPAFWSLDGFAIGAFDLAPLDREPIDTLEPATAGRRYWLWMIGEAFDWPSHGGIEPPVGSRTVEFRSRLLDALVREGAGAIRDLDGEYQIALWDRIDRKLQVLNDRFTALPIYYANSAAGLAFAGGVRGVLVAPGVSREPDLDAIRVALTVCGFRLDRRTNVRGVGMVRGGSGLGWASAAPVEQRYWHWREIPAHRAVTSDEVVED